MTHKFAVAQNIRHNRILDLRKKIDRKWTLPQLMNFCTTKLQVSKSTATSYIDEAALPYRIKYQQEQDKIFAKK